MILRQTTIGWRTVHSVTLLQSQEDSDIDLVVVSESFQEMNLRERLEVLGIGAARIMKPIEAKGYTPKEIELAPKMSFLGEILKSGITINV